MGSFSGMVFLDSMHIIVNRKNDVPLRTKDGGETWTPMDSCKLARTQAIPTTSLCFWDFSLNRLLATGRQNELWSDVLLDGQDPDHDGLRVSTPHNPTTARSPGASLRDCSWSTAARRRRTIRTLRLSGSRRMTERRDYTRKPHPSLSSRGGSEGLRVLAGGSTRRATIW